MNCLERNKKDPLLNLERDLLLGVKDMEFMKSARPAPIKTLEDYLDFLEQIEECNVPRPELPQKFYEQEFEL